MRGQRLAVLVAVAVAGLVAVPSAGAWSAATYMAVFQGDQSINWEERQDITFSPCGSGFHDKGSEHSSIGYGTFTIFAPAPGAFVPTTTSLPVLSDRQSNTEVWSDGLPCASGNCDDCVPQEPPPPDCGTKAFQLPMTLQPSGAGATMALSILGQLRDPYRNCSVTGGERWTAARPDLELVGFGPWIAPGPTPPPAGFLHGSAFRVTPLSQGLVTERTNVTANFTLLGFAPDPMRVRSRDRDTRAPAIGALSVSRGGRVSYSLSEPATAVFVLERRGRMVRGSLKREGRAGPNRARLPRALAGHRLRAGRYRLVVTAVDKAGNISKPRRTRPFRIYRAP
jgi:hypothetical protein